ncbi:Hypothetical protein UVM_LOCUS199 [uncultured virus]|nr:Hypothetical protein UVM_LOCUS199 [uncultured virus]
MSTKGTETRPVPYLDAVTLHARPGSSDLWFGCLRNSGWNVSWFGAGQWYDAEFSKAAILRILPAPPPPASAALSAVRDAPVVVPLKYGDRVTVTGKACDGTERTLAVNLPGRQSCWYTPEWRGAIGGYDPGAVWLLESAATPPLPRGSEVVYGAPLYLRSEYYATQPGLADNSLRVGNLCTSTLDANATIAGVQTLFPPIAVDFRTADGNTPGVPPSPDGPTPSPIPPPSKPTPTWVWILLALAALLLLGGLVFVLGRRRAATLAAA